MAKKAIADVESRIKKILADKVAEAADLAERVEVAKQQQKIANEEMDAATTTGDLRAYQEAKIKRRDASDAIEMYNKRLDALENRPLISESEYEKGIAQVMTALGEVSADAKKQIISHMEQIRIIAAECTAEITKGNEILHKWQHEVYRDSAEITSAKGNRIHMQHLERKFADYSIPQFASHVLENGYYKALSGQNQ